MKPKLRSKMMHCPKCKEYLVLMTCKEFEEKSVGKGAVDTGLKFGKHRILLAPTEHLLPALDGIRAGKRVVNAFVKQMEPIISPDSPAGQDYIRHLRKIHP